MVLLLSTLWVLFLVGLPSQLSVHTLIVLGPYIQTLHGTMPLSVSEKGSTWAPLAHDCLEPRQSSLVDHLHKGQEPWWGKAAP